MLQLCFDLVVLLQHVHFSCFALNSGFQPGHRNPQRGRDSWNIFGGVTSRYVMYAAIRYLLYSSFRWGCWAVVGCYNSRGTKKVEKHWSRNMFL